MDNRTFKIIAATGIPQLNSALASKEDIRVLCTVDIKSELETKVNELNPDIVIVTDRLTGDESLVKMLTHLKRTNQFIRFIYLCGDVSPRDIERINALGTLVLMGIYDIIIGKRITIDIVDDAIHYPKKESSVSYLTTRLLSDKSEVQAAIGGIEYEDLEPMEAEDNTTNNVFVFTSIKPGTGKSFVSVNSACAIAKYGKDKPRVALVEADLQTLSIGTLLAIEDDKKKNLRTCMEAIGTILDKGNIVGDEEAVKTVNRMISNCMVPYKHVDNLDVLVGSSMSPEEVESMKVSPEHYLYLLNVLSQKYDVVIIDMNSSLFHVTSFPLLQRAKTCFYILNLDINNIRNNLRYRKTLESLHITHKIHWVLNEDVQNTKEFKSAGVDMETLLFTGDRLEKEYFKLSGRIPIIPKTVFLNRLYDGTPVVLDNDVPYTNHAKLALLQIANQAYPISGEIEKLQKKLDKQNQGSFFDRLFGSKSKQPKEKQEKPVKEKKPKKGKKKTSESVPDEAADDIE